MPSRTSKTPKAGQKKDWWIQPQPRLCSRLCSSSAEPKQTCNMWQWHGGWFTVQHPSPLPGTWDFQKSMKNLELNEIIPNRIGVSAKSAHHTLRAWNACACVLNRYKRAHAQALTINNFSHTCSQVVNLQQGCRIDAFESQTRYNQIIGSIEW